MTRRLASYPVRMKGGPTLGGSGTRLYVYDDEALTTLSTLYQRATGAGQQPNYLTPNAGKQTTLRTATLTTDTVLAVVSIASFNVGDMVPIVSGATTVWRIITALNAVGPTMTVDSAVGVAFAVATTLINRPSMRGWIYFWVDDVRDYFYYAYDVGATEQMPPAMLPTRVPATTLAFQDEGVSTGASRSTLNFIGEAFAAVDNAGAARVDLTHDMTLHHAYRIGTIRNTGGDHYYSGIPATWEHLLFIGTFRFNSAGRTLYLNLNEDFGANYDWGFAYLGTAWTVPTPGTGASQIQLGYAADSGAAAGRSGTVILFIPNYKRTSNYKNVSWTGAEGNTAYVGSGSRKNTAAITAIRVGASAGGFSIDESTLYGLM